MQPKADHHLFHFSRRERSGIIVLIIISILARTIPYVLEGNLATAPVPFSEEDWAGIKIIADTPSRYTADLNVVRDLDVASELFEFDPNTLNEAGWRKLGVPEKTVMNIRKYVSKGGKFYKAADIAKIYGLSPGKAKQLEPYVHIAENPGKKYVPYEKKSYPVQQVTVDINRADSAAFESLRGIGPTLAKRIIAFREKLGGFYAINQVGEVYGLQDSTFQKIKSSLRLAPFEVRKFNINTAGKEELQSHPYIRYKIASLIVAYRQQHGNFQRVGDIRNIAGISGDLYEKMKHYLTIE